MEDDPKEKYRQYLKSEHWHNLREQKLNSRRKCCEDCGKTKNLQVHHLFYRERWEDSRIEDLKILCDKCHKKTHNIKEKQRKSNFNQQSRNKQPKNKKRKFNKYNNLNVPFTPAEKARAERQRRSIRESSRPGNTHFIIFPD